MKQGFWSPTANWAPKMALADPIHQPDPQRTNKREKELTERAVEGPERWSLLSNEYRFQCHRVEHNDIQQGWIVFDSATARIVAFNKPRPNGW